MLTTALFGGTFNPFHIGHYEMLSAINELVFIDEIWVLPDNVPPHKECDFLASDNDRIEMCKIAAADFNKAKVSLLEFERKGKSYTFDTVCKLEKNYPDRKFYFVIGGDMLTSLHTWYRYEELIKKIDFIAFKRKGNSGDFDKALKRLLKDGAKITVLPEEITEISSSEIRNNLDNNELASLLPMGIYEYIKKKGIYNAR